MKSSLLRMLGALMCALAVSANVIPAQDFDMEKIAGKWYTAAMASDAQWFVNSKAGMKMGTAVLTPTPEGDLVITHANLQADGTCWRLSHHANKTDTPGRFFFYSSVWKNDNDMQFLKFQYDDYAFVSINKTRDGVSDILNVLYKRNQELSDELQQEFKQFTLEKGIQSDNIIMLPKHDECAED